MKNHESQTSDQVHLVADGASAKSLQPVLRTFVLPTKPLSIIDGINRMCLATGGWRNAGAGSHADYNGHRVEVRFNDHRGYWVAQYQWCDRVVVARGGLAYCLQEAKSFYANDGRGAAVEAKVCTDEDAALCIAAGYIPAEAEDRSWRDWKFEEINLALEMERRGFGPYTSHLIAATSPEDFRARCHPERVAA